MKKEINEVYAYYKKQYTGVILFHIGKYYEAYNDDAKQIKSIAATLSTYDNEAQEKDICRVSDDSQTLFNLIKNLEMKNVPVHTICYIGSEGKYTLPKLKQIEQDMEEDY